MKSFISVFFVLLTCATPSLAWSSQDCPYSKKEGNGNASSEKVEESKVSKDQ